MRFLDDRSDFRPTRLWCNLGGGGAAGTTIPIAPPASLFPGSTTALAQQGPGAIGTATSVMEGIASGSNIQSIYNSVVAASKQQEQMGRANTMSSMGTEGMASSSDAMRSTQQYEQQFQASLLSQLGQMSLQNEQLQLGGAEGLMSTYGNAGMTFAPTEAVVGTTGSMFSQISSAVTGGAMSSAMLLTALAA